MVSAFQKPVIMGIINLSPDSFYQASPNFVDALKKAEAMVMQGAAMIDVGAVATNPNINLHFETPSVQQELDAVLPFIEALSKSVDVMISVDTSRAAVMDASIKAGAHMINDQRSLMEENALETAIKLNVPVCLMHHFNPARQPGSSACAELLTQIKHDLQNNIARCMAAGIAHENIIIDPGFGGGNFGKSADENFYVLAHLNTLVDLSLPILVGLSRKSFFGELLKADIEERLYASIAGAVIAAEQGAAILRVHDVKATLDAMSVLQKVQDLRNEIA
ncbi:MAG: dihydropteroate synthase [Gammaproteobacteria bacterium RIFCSPHIGHO2_12_FULL_40_19]|nr:MAG: dihydropteroate synthase [Gammaproteobacteria bacterium RIFCSPHIGHO2_12_FULL_40_19]